MQKLRNEKVGCCVGCWRILEKVFLVFVIRRRDCTCVYLTVVIAERNSA
jgi:hypothetical protein